MTDKLYREANLNQLEEKLNFEFQDRSLLRRALTHRSFPNENKELEIEDNERLEFLGDSVLGLAISTHLIHNYPRAAEGKLAKMKSRLVSEVSLARRARDLEMNRHLLLGHGEELTGGRDRDSILADAFEALLGAIYLEKDFECCQDFIIDLFQEDFQRLRTGDYLRDYKTILQEKIQKNIQSRPVYEVISEEGPDHDKSFVVSVELEGNKLGKGRGSSKKKAEQRAARDALKNIDNRNVNLEGFK